MSAGLRAAEEGADLIDVGGVKFAPGDPLDPAEEAARVVPVIEQLRRELPGEVLLSVDTFHASVARAALEVGADLINDTTGLSDPRMAEEVARAGASLVLTHSVAEPRRPFPRPRYEDVVEEVRDFLAARLERALEAGIARERIVLDPGPDSSKSTQQTSRCCATGSSTPRSACRYSRRSRKDFVGESLGLPKEERLAGSSLRRPGRSVWAPGSGHDVRETVRMVRMLEVLAGWREPAGPLVHNV